MSEEKKSEQHVQIARTLTDDDVAEMQKRISQANPDVINDIYRRYSDCLNGLISLAREQTTDETEIVELERLKRIINLAPIDERFIRSKDKIWNVREHIINKDSKFFMERDYSANIKKDHNQTFIETIIEITKDKFTTLSDKEKDFYWKKAATLLNCVVRFKKELGEY